MNKGLSSHIGKAACHITAVACVCTQPRHAGHSHCPTCLESVAGAATVRNAPNIKGSKLETVGSRGQPGDLETVWYLRDGSKVSHNWETVYVCVCVYGEEEGREERGRGGGRYERGREGMGEGRGEEGKGWEGRGGEGRGKGEGETGGEREEGG